MTKITAVLDTIILGTALAGNAHYLVSGDEDLLVLKSHPGVKPLEIIKPRAFLDILYP